MTVPAALKELEKIEYDTAVKDLQKLLDKSDAQRKDTLWKAILKSEKTYDEILRLYRVQVMESLMSNKIRGS